MLCFRVILWGITLVIVMIPGAFLVGIIGRIAGFRPGSKVSGTETAFGWVGIIVLGSIMLGMCLFAGLIDWAVSAAVEHNAGGGGGFDPPPQRANLPIARPKPIPNDWDDKKMQKTFLSDMQEFNARVGWGAFGKKGKLGYISGIGDSVRVDNKFYPNSISMHPPSNGNSAVQYRLNNDKKLFKSWAALNDNEGQALFSAATFAVFGDGVCLWVSSPINRVALMEPCRISVEGVNTLELQVHCPGNHSNIRAVWVEPQLFK